MNYLDRYLANYFAACSSGGAPRITKKQFQLVTMGCLYVAMKIQGSARIPVDYMVKLSRGTIQTEDLLTMEVELLSRLSWKVNPPTAYDFLKHYSQLLQPVCGSGLMADDQVPKSPRLTALEELAAFLVELSVLDYYFVNFRASTVAVAALLNAMDEDPLLATANPFLQAHTLNHGYDAFILPGEEEAVYLCRRRLGYLYHNADSPDEESPAPTSGASAEQDDKSPNRMTSPVCVINATTNPYSSA